MRSSRMSCGMHPERWRLNRWSQRFGWCNRMMGRRGGPGRCAPNNETKHQDPDKNT